MTYSIIAVHRREGNRVDGSWLQDSVGSLEKAREVARRTSERNHGMDVAVTEPVHSSAPLAGSPYTGLRVV